MILWLRFLDFIEHRWRRHWKFRRLKKRYGERWEDFSRSGRQFRRVEHGNITGTIFEEWRILTEPGWEWTCQNCRTYSFIRESDMPAILKEWQDMCANAIKRGYKVPVKPTAATAGCTNCKFRPGDPE
jgi:hypothetical protein